MSPSTPRSREFTCLEATIFDTNEPENAFGKREEDQNNKENLIASSPPITKIMIGATQTNESLKENK